MTSSRQFLERLVCASPEAILVTTCGLISRDLYAVADRPEHFYMVGSMGAALPIALGIVLARPDQRVIAVDGDGSFLMNLGATAMVSQARPRNLVHVVLDNGLHESTGGQRTVGGNIPALMIAAGYSTLEVISTPGEITRAVVAQPGPLGLYARVARRSEPAPPRVVPHPAVLAARVRELLGAGAGPAPGTWLADSR